MIDEQLLAFHPFNLHKGREPAKKWDINSDNIFIRSAAYVESLNEAQKEKEVLQFYVSCLNGGLL